MFGVKNLSLSFVAFSFLVWTAFSAPLKTELQIQEQQKALKRLESDLQKNRSNLKRLEKEEKSVISTMALLDQNLNQSKEYVAMLGKNEEAVKTVVGQLSKEISSLDQKIAKQKKAMEIRIRTLYMQGRHSEAEHLYLLIKQQENPERLLYMVNKLLSSDKVLVETLIEMQAERAKKHLEEQKHLESLKDLRAQKAIEEKQYFLQLEKQKEMLSSLRRDKSMQEKVLGEFEKNQKTMLALIKRLQEKKKKEEAKARKRALEQKKKAERDAKKSKTPVKTTPPPATVTKALGPKTMPLQGAIISEYGLQDHPVLHIKTKNLGVEIRGKKGAKVKAAAKGSVAMVAEIDGRGPSIIIEHEGGYYSVYGHLNSVFVKEGDFVKNGQEIGEVGDIASLNGIKLYFQVSQGTQTIDPLNWLKTK